MLNRFNAITFILIFIFINTEMPAHSSEEKSGAEKAGFSKHFKGSFFAITEKGEFSIEILPDEEEYKIGRDVIGIVVHDRHDEDVEGADINITHEGMTEQPVVKDKGEGLYTAGKLNLRKEGSWKLKITIKKKRLEDSATFVFPDVLNKRLPAGKYNPKNIR